MRVDPAEDESPPQKQREHSTASAPFANLPSSDQLSDVEIERLRQIGRETSAKAAKAFAHLRKA